MNDEIIKESNRIAKKWLWRDPNRCKSLAYDIGMAILRASPLVYDGNMRDWRDGLLCTIHDLLMDGDAVISVSSDIARQLDDAYGPRPAPRPADADDRGPEPTTSLLPIEARRNPDDAETVEVTAVVYINQNREYTILGGRADEHVESIRVDLNEAVVSHIITAHVPLPTPTEIAADVDE